MENLKVPTKLQIYFVVSRNAGALFWYSNKKSIEILFCLANKGQKKTNAYQSSTVIMSYSQTQFFRRMFWVVDENGFFFYARMIPEI